MSVKESPTPPAAISAKNLKGLVWVTRASPHIDRLASAWLVRQFIDPKAKFKFVTPPYAARPKEIRFDMPEGEFTHFGNWYTFEMLVHRLHLEDATIISLVEIIHDIDLKDRKYSRPEAPGIAFFDGLYATLGAEGNR